MKADHSKKLEEFTAKLKEMPEIIGIYYKGSTATASWDKFSDIDIDIIVKDKDYTRIVKMLPKILSMWGEVKFSNHYEDYDETYGFIGKEYFKIEIDPINEKKMKDPDFDFKDIKIVYDKTGKLAEIQKKSQRLKRPYLDKKYFVWNLLDTRSNFIYVATKYARGQKFEGVDEIDHMRTQMFKMLAKTKGLEDYELGRTAEKNLAKNERMFWENSKCQSEEKREVRRSLKVCWKFMKYLETKYEKISGKKLNLKCNDREIWGVIEKFLEIAK